jgi:hypothetical protein
MFQSSSAFSFNRQVQSVSELLIDPRVKFFAQDVDRFVAFEAVFAQPTGELLEMRLAAIPVPRRLDLRQTGLDHKISGFGCGAITSERFHQFRIDFDLAV